MNPSLPLSSHTASQEQKRGYRKLRRTWASLGNPSITPLIPVFKICTGGSNSDLAMQPVPTAPRFRGLSPDQLWKPRLAGMGCGRKGPQRNFLSAAAQVEWAGLTLQLVPLVPLTGGFLKTLEGRSFSDLLSDPTYLWASGDPSIKWTEGNASSLGVFLSL